MAAGVLINAAWDLWAKFEGKPLWKLLVDMQPEELVAAIDFHWISDALSPTEALQLLRDLSATKSQREAEMLQEGFPAYTTSAGWLGYADEKIKSLAEEYMREGHTH